MLHQWTRKLGLHGDAPCEDVVALGRSARLSSFGQSHAPPRSSPPAPTTTIKVDHTLQHSARDRLRAALQAVSLDAFARVPSAAARASARRRSR